MKFYDSVAPIHPVLNSSSSSFSFPFSNIRRLLNLTRDPINLRIILGPIQPIPVIVILVVLHPLISKVQITANTAPPLQGFLNTASHEEAVAGGDIAAGDGVLEIRRLKQVEASRGVLDEEGFGRLIFVAAHRETECDVVFQVDGPVVVCAIIGVLEFNEGDVCAVFRDGLHVTQSETRYTHLVHSRRIVVHHSAGAIRHDSGVCDVDFIGPEGAAANLAKGCGVGVLLREDVAVRAGGEHVAEVFADELSVLEAVTCVVWVDGEGGDHSVAGVFGGVGGVAEHADDVIVCQSPVAGEEVRGVVGIFERDEC